MTNLIERRSQTLSKQTAETANTLLSPLQSEIRANEKLNPFTALKKILPGQLEIKCAFIVEDNPWHCSPCCLFLTGIFTGHLPDAHMHLQAAGPAQNRAKIQVRVPLHVHATQEEEQLARGCDGQAATRGQVTVLQCGQGGNPLEHKKHGG